MKISSAKLGNLISLRTYINTHKNTLPITGGYYTLIGMILDIKHDILTVQWFNHPNEVKTSLLHRSTIDILNTRILDKD